MIQFDSVTYTYPGGQSAALQQVSFDLPAGCFALVAGPSGAGKSTLLRCINGLVPHFSGGDLHGSIRVNGLDPVQATPRQMSRHVGFVFQDPESQFVVDRVEDEIAFALENEAVAPEEMHSTINQLLELLGLNPLRKRPLEALSGGERQKVAIAAALALRPKVLVLDEPTSQLDPTSAEELLQTLVQLNHSHGLTIVLAEQRLERILPFSDQLVYLDKDHPGTISGPPRQVLGQIDIETPLIKLGKWLGWQPLPLTVAAAQDFAQKYSDNSRARTRVQRSKGINTSAYIQVCDLEVSYGGTAVFTDINLEVFSGQIIVLMGPNGAGKTTLLNSMVGLVSPQHGKVTVAGKDTANQHVADICREVGFLPQDPNALLFADTVEGELLITLRNHQLPPEQYSPGAMLEQFAIADLAGHYPRDLSVGQRQRVALAAIMITRPGALLLDEPTRGLDYTAKQGLGKILQDWRDQGVAILLVTHDVELAATIADRVVLLQGGRITADGDPAAVLGSSAQFRPQVAELFPNRGWLTVEDAWGHLKAHQD